jgi:hypothetical protein
MGVIEYNSIRKSTSSTAAIGIFFIPFYVAPVALVSALWGLTLRGAWQTVRGFAPRLTPIVILSWVIALGVPAAGVWVIQDGLGLRHDVQLALRMNGPELETAFERSPRNRDRFFLGAIAQNPAADAALLDRIASIPDPALYRRMWSHWDVMGENGKGLAVMRLIVGNANVSPETIEKLASNSYADEYLLGDILGNPKTPARIIERHANATQYLLKWGLASNPKTPVEVLERLAKDPDPYTSGPARYNLDHR